jgi:hypothetical protein
VAGSQNKTKHMQLKCEVENLGASACLKALNQYQAMESEWLLGSLIRMDF